MTRGARWDRAERQCAAAGGSSTREHAERRGHRVHRHLCVGWGVCPVRGDGGDRDFRAAGSVHGQKSRGNHAPPGRPQGAAPRNKPLPWPPQDEIFHVPQTQAFCRAEFREPRPPRGPKRHSARPSSRVGSSPSRTPRADVWDPKITTFPGAYLMPMAVSNSSFQLLQELWCSVFGLRLVSAGAGAFAAAMTAFAAGRLSGLAGILGHHPAEVEEVAAILAGLAAALWPVHSFFSTMWYTDSTSTAMLMATFAISLPQQPEGDMGTMWFGTAAVGAFAVFCRQTNAVWLVFIAAGMLLRTHLIGSRGGPQRDSIYSLGEAYMPAPGTEPKDERRKPQGNDAPLQPYQGQGNGCDVYFHSWTGQPVAEAAGPTSAADAAFSIRREDLPSSTDSIAVGVVVLAFGLFVLVNGGVAIGDRSNHRPAAHFAQTGYALTAACLVVQPLLLAAPAALRALAWEFLTGRCLGCTRGGAAERLAAASAALRTGKPAPADDGPARGARACGWGTRALLLVLLALAAAAAAGFGTHEHPFLLADNRHIVFYVWSWVFRGNQWLWFALGPVYLAAAALCAAVIVAVRPARTHGGSAALADVFLLCALVSTGLAPVLEPRYWTPVVLLVVAHAAPLWAGRSRGAAFVLIGLLAAVSMAVWALFVFRPFRWHDGSTARFMW